MKKIFIAISVFTVTALMQGCFSSGKAAAGNWDGKQFSILESHWGAPTQKDANDDGSYTAIFKAGDDCTATFNVDAQGVILSHEFTGNSCSFDSYNRLQNIEH